METKATSKGQIVIPAEVRRKFGIKQGTRISVQVDEEAHAIVLKPITREFIESLRGIDRGTAILRELVDQRESDKNREERQLKPSAGKSRRRS